MNRINAIARALFTTGTGKKILTGITGLGLTLFVIAHMVGNLSYFAPDEQAYNAYSHKLISLGPILWIVEIGLVAFLLVHALIGVRIYMGKRRARQHDYAEYKSAGMPSRQSLSSRSMILTGVILFVFLIFHILSFKYGPGIAEGYIVEVKGEEIRDMRRLLDEKFSHATYAFGYPIVMILLGFHLRHGIWSAFQSLGAMSGRMSPLVYTAGAVLAVAVAVGFLVLPLYIYFGGGA